MSNHQSPQALLMSPFNNLNNLSSLNLNFQAQYNQYDQQIQLLQQQIRE